MQNLFQRLSTSQQWALVCGVLCLLVSLILVSVASFSSRFILQTQQNEYGDMVASESAATVSTMLARGELIGLEVQLEQMVALNQLSGIRVYDVEHRQIGAAGSEDGPAYQANIQLDRKIAGQLEVFLADNTAMREQRSMLLPLLMLAALLSLFGAALAARMAQTNSARLQHLLSKLGVNSSAERNELARLEQAVEQLPIELLQPADESTQDSADYSTTGLMFVRLDSLVGYVETLDESTLVRYTNYLHRVIQSCAELYGGELQVSRQFSVLVCFAGEHKSGSPVFRAACTAWLLQQLSQSLREHSRLKLDLSLSCGVSEAGSPITGHFYSALYGQHLVDEMEALCNEQSGDILLCEDLVEDTSLVNKWHLESAGNNINKLGAATAPTDSLLERQHEMLRAQLSKNSA